MEMLNRVRIRLMARCRCESDTYWFATYGALCLVLTRIEEMRRTKI